MAKNPPTPPANGTPPADLATVTPINIDSEMRQSYMDYAMSVIIGRALPDVRDGLKPVQRRVLYAMLSEGLVSNRKHSKCAGVVGEVLKRFHPHGDSSVYDALVRLAQPWTLRYPLVDGQGNFGSVDGDPAAAYRYTECRMTALSERLLEDIEKDTVEFAPNFDDSTMEPVVLPSVIPNLLVNGGDGIAVGMATHLPPHNLTEVINGTLALLKNPSISLAELMSHIPGPDFPTAGIIYGRAPIVSAYRDGKGVLQMRARATFETQTSKGRELVSIVITEIPFQVNKARLIERIADLVNEKTIEGIARLRDESDRSGMRIVVELKRDATPDVVLNQLFKLTPLQTSFGVINLAIVEGQPVICSLQQLLTHFVSHRRDVVTRRTQFDLRKAQERMHLLEGFRIALLNLDAVIKLIKESPTPKDAKEGLERVYKLSELQAQAILDLRLQKLTGMERLSIEQEHAALAKEIERLLSILSDTAKVDAIIRSELEVIRDNYGDKRRTEIVDDGGEIGLEDLIEDEEMVVSISHNGYVKRTSTVEYRAQKRGGKGVFGAASGDDDFIEHLFVTSSLSDLLVFTSLGRLYRLKVYDIPAAGRTARGRAIINLLQLKAEETPMAFLPVKEIVTGKFVVVATKQGTIKKMDLMEFENARKAGVIACTIHDGDSLVGAHLLEPGDEVILATKSGMAIRFAESDVRAMGRGAAGVRGISLEAGDEVVGMTIVTKVVAETSEDNNPPTLLTVCRNGYGKRSAMTEYRTQNRGGKGLIDIQAEERNGPVVGIAAVNNQSQLMLITSAGKIIRFNAQDLSVIGRNTKGVRVIGLDAGEHVAAVARMVADSLGENGGDETETTVEIKE